MATRTDLTPEAHEAFQAREKHAYWHCVEAVFGSTLRAKPASSPAVPDSIVSWEATGDPRYLQIYSSVDDGATWQLLVNGEPIQQSDGKGGRTPVPIGTRMTNRRVLLRQVFLSGGSGVTLESITVAATMTSGEIVSRTETGALLSEGRLDGVSDKGDGVRMVPISYLELLGDGGCVGRSEAAPHTGDDRAPQHLHISHGIGLLTKSGAASAAYVEQQGSRDDDRYEKASCAIEGWIYPTKTDGMIWNWSTFQGDGDERLGFSCWLEGATPTTATLKVKVIEVEPIFGGGRFYERIDIFPRVVISDVGVIALLRWTHIAVSYDGFWMNVYINGVLVARWALRAQTNRAITVDKSGKERKVAIGIAIPTDGNFVIGRNALAREDSDSWRFGGRLSEWRVWSTPLTVGDIVGRMRRRLNESEVAHFHDTGRLVAYWPMDDAMGTVVEDASGADLHLPFIHGPGGNTLLPVWANATDSTWYGFPTGFKPIADGVEPVDWSPGRESPPLSLDVEGDVIRLTNRPGDVYFPPGTPWNAKRFIGVGGLGELSLLQEPGELVPTGAELRLNGLIPQHVSLALSAEYMDRPLRIWLVIYDETDTLISTPVLVFEGRMDTFDVSLGEISATVSVTAESHLRRWSSPGHQRWNHQAQLTLYKDDYGFEFLAEMVDKEVWWPARLADKNSTPTESTG